MTQQSETQELKPCPLAHQVVNGLNISSSSGMRKWHLTCFDCGLVFEGQLDETARSLFNRWNTRAPVDSQGAGEANYERLAHEILSEYNSADDPGLLREKVAEGFASIASDAATQMRDACAEAAKQTVFAKMVRLGISAERSIQVSAKAKSALMSLTLDQVKQETNE